MDRLWQWVWDRYGPRYFRALYAAMVPLSLPVYLLWSFLIVAVEKSGHYVEAAAVTVVAATVLQWVALFQVWGSVALWSGGRRVRKIDRAKALAATYALTRKIGCSSGNGQRCLGRRVIGRCRCDRRATGSRLVQYVVLGVV